MDGSSNHNSNPNPARIILIPFMAQGHMIPMVDMARLLASSGALVTFITTPVNAARIRPIIDHIENSHLPVRFVQLPFPSADAGLPAGCENADLISSPDLFKSFMEALSLFGEQVKLYLTAANSTAVPADCIIFDCLNSWVRAVAKSLDIPHIMFYGPSCFYILCAHLLKKHQVLKSIDDDYEPFKVPELPEPVEVMKAQVMRWMDRPGWEKISEEFYKTEKSAFGVVMNTFEELEKSGLDKFRKEIGKKVWPIGPLSLANKDLDSKVMRGKASSIDTGVLSSWLDSKTPNSVMFVSFGSLSRNPISQLVQIGQGLESASSSQLSFIWVVKEAERSEEVENWLAEFEERTKGRGMVIRGWAPQAMILGHVTVGGFMTHCGWNSTLEAIAAGVVMATWPRFGDQFVNERLVVDVLRIGVAVGAKVPIFYADEMSGKGLVKGEEVRKVVEKVMQGGEEGEERRKRAKELAEKARKAMEEGGSSFENLKRVIQFAEGEKKHFE
ncbi:UDP-glycosyltransferase 73C4-like [Dendrobium catenatum]|uniref:UDP-glycosyltransferase 73C4 n=1 Tax=Dendrobium catenatum TaxID=906689 RepID=A0A2I0WBE0_9ASPA|nr:UDP-glycosyltransferase 73C4-like [Dendrobium catenatum]PKU72968.1 UDP-glycosyltransferase 73C4 [Dendrobium catenatum]